MKKFAVSGVKHLSCVVCVLLCFSFMGRAQEITETNTDIIYKTALDSYKGGEFEESLKFAIRGLELAPGYHDIRILRVRNYWVLGKFETADKDLDFLLQEAPQYVDVKPLIFQRINHYGSAVEALEFIEGIEKIYPGEHRLQTRKAQLLLESGENEEARAIAMDLLAAPHISGAQRYALQIILNRTATDEIGLSYQLMSFSEDYSRSDSWNSIRAEYQHNFGRTAVIGRVIYTDRSYDDGVMYELEAYPVFNDRWYAYTNIGFSDSEIFPDVRSNISVYHNFAEVFEAEVGGRLLHFTDSDFFTGILGLSLYEGRFLFNIRSFVGPERKQQLIQNYQGNIRYYLNNADNYLFLRAGTGISPDDRIRHPQIKENPRLKAFYSNAGVRHLFWNQHILQLTVGLLREEISAGSIGEQITGSLSYRFRF